MDRTRKPEIDPRSCKIPNLPFTNIMLTVHRASHPFKPTLTRAPAQPQNDLPQRPVALPNARRKAKPTPARNPQLNDLVDRRPRFRFPVARPEYGGSLGVIRRPPTTFWMKYSDPRLRQPGRRGTLRRRHKMKITLRTSPLHQKYRAMALSHQMSQILSNSHPGLHHHPLKTLWKRLTLFREELYRKRATPQTADHQYPVSRRCRQSLHAPALQL